MEELLVCEETIQAMLEAEKCARDCSGLTQKCQDVSMTLFKEDFYMTIGIIGAMEEEVSILKDEMTIEETVNHAGMVFCKGSLCGRDVVIVRSGIGKVNAAVCTQVLVDKFDVLNL